MQEREEQEQLAAKRICAIYVGKQFIGTGFLIADDLIMTNFHVYESGVNLPDNTQPWVAYFDHRDTHTRIDQRPQVVIRKNGLLAGSRVGERDFAILALEQAVGRDRGFFELFENVAGYARGTKVMVMGYPGVTAPAGDATAGIQAGALLRESGEIIYDYGQAPRFGYSAFTAKGSSGSPVLDDRYRLVGLHHHGQEQRQNSGIQMYAIIEELRQPRHASILVRILRPKVANATGRPRPAGILESAAAVEAARSELPDPISRREFLVMQLDRNPVAGRFKGYLRQQVTTVACVVLLGPCKAGHDKFQHRLEYECRDDLQQRIDIAPLRQKRKLSPERLLEHVVDNMAEATYQAGARLALSFRMNADSLANYELSLVEFVHMVQELLPQLTTGQPRPGKLIAFIKYEWKPATVWQWFGRKRSEPDLDSLAEQLQEQPSRAVRLLPLRLEPINRGHIQDWAGLTDVRQTVPNVSLIINTVWLDQHIGDRELEYEDAIELLIPLLSKEI